MTYQLDKRFTERQLEILDYLLHYSVVDEKLLEYLGDDISEDTDDQLYQLEVELHQLQELINKR